MMLKSLNISNFAVIRFLSIDFNAGLNVLTGETGAGKSIIVDALSLLLGGRAMTNVVRTGEKISLIEGVFELEAISEERVKQELSEVGVELTNEEFLTVRREVQVGGRSRIFVNDRNVTLTTLKKLQPFLVEIHGQGEQRSLLAPQVHLLLLDNFAGCAELRRQVSVKYEEWKKLVEELDATTRDQAERERLSDMLQFQIAEIERFSPQPGEEEQLSEEKKLLTHAERLLELNSSAYQALYESEESVLSRLGAIRRTLQTLETIDSRFFPLLRTIEEATLSLSDVADTLRSYAGGMGDYTPARLSAVEERLSEFERLKRKYGRDVKDLLEIRSDLRQQLDQLLNWEERQSLLSEKLAIIVREYRDLAGSLTAVRRSAISDFEKRVMEGLRFVALENARFAVILQTAREDHKLLSGESSAVLPKSESVESPASASSRVTSLRRAQTTWSFICPPISGNRLGHSERWLPGANCPA
jgi:DNA repair protein RecN (Recombination protein N)